MKGKNKCKILKEIRQKIADENDIPYVTRECTYQGDCKGTCPKCEAELRYLEQELEKRRSLGKTVAVAAVAAGLSLSLTACKPRSEGGLPGDTGDIAGMLDTVSPETEDALPGEVEEIVGKIDTMPPEAEEPLLGQVLMPPEDTEIPGEATEPTVELEGDVAVLPADTESADGAEAPVEAQ